MVCPRTRRSRCSQGPSCAYPATCCSRSHLGTLRMACGVLGRQQHLCARPCEGISCKHRLQAAQPYAAPERAGTVLDGGDGHWGYACKGDAGLGQGHAGCGRESGLLELSSSCCGPNEQPGWLQVSRVETTMTCPYTRQLGQCKNPF